MVSVVGKEAPATLHTESSEAAQSEEWGAGRTIGGQDVIKPAAPRGID